MLEFSHIELTDKKQTHILCDVSFRFPSVGMTSICGDSDTLHTYLAQLLAGFRKPDQGTLTYQGTVISLFKNEERALYRSNCMTSLFSDFQIIEHKSVLYNIYMGQSYAEEKVNALLQEWGLSGKETMRIGELPFTDQMKAILIRILLRNLVALVVYPHSSPYSSKEMIQFYPFLKRISKSMAVIVVGDNNSNTFSDRIIEIREGHITSDSSQSQFDQSVDKKQLPFRIGLQLRQTFYERLSHRFRWKFRVLTMLILLGFICLSAAIFATMLNVADIEMTYLKENKYSTIAISKYAQGKDGTVYNKSFATINETDVTSLQQRMKGSLVAGYYPQNTNILSEQRNQTFQEYSLIEADDVNDVGLTIHGQYPKTYNEVALSLQDARLYFKDSIDDPKNNGDAYMKQIVYWFNVPLTITGIIQPADNNHNLDFNMNYYQGSINKAGLGSGSLYVKKGFHNTHVLAQQKVFRKTYKRVRDILTSTAYNVSDFYPIQYSTYYSNGTTEYMDIKDIDKQLHSDEVLLSFSMAMQLGYDSIYTSNMYINEYNQEQRKQSYEKFAKKWSGKTIQVQAYEAQNAPSNTSVFTKNMKIKGFLFPISWDYDDTYMYTAGNVYMNENVIKPYLQPNYRIKELYFHTDNSNDMRDSLNYLLEHDQYAAYLSKPILMQFFVVDLKILTVFFAIGGGIALMLSVIILVRVVKDVCQYLKKEVSVYHMFGEQQKYIKRMYIQYFIDVLSKRILIGWIGGTLVLAGYVLVIFFKIAMETSILYSLLLPLGLSVLFLLCMMLILLTTLYREKVTDDEFTSDVY